MLPSWIEKYVGLPFLDLGRDTSGLDCWGLVKLIYGQELGIELPDYFTYSSVTDFEEVEATILRVKASWDKVEIPAEKDVVLFNCANQPLHVGVVVNRYQFLHSPQGDFTRIESFKSGIWNKRLEGFYRL